MSDEVLIECVREYVVLYDPQNRYYHDNVRKENAWIEISKKMGQTELKKENKEIRDRLDEVNDRVEWLEKEKRKKNALVTGVNMDTTQAADLKEYMQDIFKNLLAVEVQVKSTQKLGSRACLVEFEKEEDKEKLMKNKHKLKHFKDGKIFINEDATKKEREKAKQIRMIAKEERGKGKQVKIGYSKLIIDGQLWKWNNATNSLEISKN
nr:unnamed protein product [Callosobruchus chinensis]